MDTILLTLSEKDGINMALYVASKSAQVKKSRKRAWFAFGVFILLLSLVFFSFGKLFGSLILALGTVVFILFPTYLRIYSKSI